jgi:hypothetical protein
MIKDNGRYGTLCISQPPGVIDIFKDERHPIRHLGDVAFFDGKLYALCGFGILCIVELGNDLCIASTECIIHSLHELGGIPKSLPKVDNRGYTVAVYLVECGGRLLIVKRWLSPYTISRVIVCRKHPFNSLVGLPRLLSLLFLPDLGRPAPPLLFSGDSRR